MVKLKNKYIRFVFIFFVLFKFFTIYYMIINLSLNNEIKSKEKFFEISKQEFIEKLDFNFNETGFPFNIVPNIVHYILFDVRSIDFVHFVSILSVLKNQKPEVIYFHCNCHKLNGEYYQRAIRLANITKTKFIIHPIKKIRKIFDQPLNEEWINFHGTDLARIRILRKYGGIALDKDVYVVKSLDVFRKYEMTLNWDKNQDLATQTQIAHKNARFLKLWLKSYHDFRPEEWYYNAGELPIDSWELIHRVKWMFGADAPAVCPLIYSEYYEDWREEFYSIHLNIRGNELSHKYWCFGHNEEEYPLLYLTRKTFMN